MSTITYDKLSQEEKDKRHKDFWDKETLKQIELIRNMSTYKRIGTLIAYITINADYIKHNELPEHTVEMADTILTLTQQLEELLEYEDMIEDAFGDEIEIIDEEYFTKYEPWYQRINKVAKENNLPVITGDECGEY
tara:strand:+ start:102 stop:509 length:408 start_codon:yes stop_codon:yes gene_type:complete